MITEKVFAVSGMKCEHCKATVERALKSVAGVSEVEASLEDKTVRVVYDDATATPKALKDAVAASGRYELSL